jgi:YVTN family beta-propeller protein
MRRLAVLVLAIDLTAAACGSTARPQPRTQASRTQQPRAAQQPLAAQRPAASSTPQRQRLDVYAYDRPGMLSPVVRGFPARIYVPDSESNDVVVIDPATYRKIARFPVGRRPQHVVPSWDLKTLWVNDNDSNDLVPINPATGKPGRKIAVSDPYNLYFTPNGRYAVVMAERNNALDIRDPHSMKLVREISLPCRGINHADYTADGAYFIASCEFSGHVLQIDATRWKVVKVLQLKHHAMPQDVKLSPDGTTFYVADMATNGVWMIDAATFRNVGFIPTGKGAHGLYVSRDGSRLYVSDRGAGAVSVISLATRQVVARWKIPGGGSPDMGGVSADGKVLWLSGRYHGVVYAISTTDGHLIRKIPVGRGPHGLCVYPQPGRFSLGHTGILR